MGVLGDRDRVSTLFWLIFGREPVMGVKSVFFAIP